jgi:uncharacterized membrane protein YkoI
MRNRDRTALLTLLATLLLLAGPAVLPALAPSALAHEEHDEDQARRALEAGEVLPLDNILTALGQALAGEISAVELEREHGIWIYEFKIISPEGRMKTVRVDAKTAKLVRPQS